MMVRTYWTLGLLVAAAVVLQGCGASDRSTPPERAVLDGAAGEAPPTQTTAEPVPPVEAVVPQTSDAEQVAKVEEPAALPEAPKEAAVDTGLAQDPELGRGPGLGGDRYDRIVENSFVAVKTDPRSTFSIDVDTASYAKAREFLTKYHRLPPRDAVRLEEFINYFTYDYAEPTDGRPFAVHADVAACPWRPVHRLVRIGLQGRHVDRQQRPAANLVFLLDVSGSMSAADKLPLVLQGMQMLVGQLTQNDRVGIVVYAGAAGMVLDSTSCDRKQDILGALRRLKAGGSTNGGQGIQLAYRLAREHFVEGGTNRVMLCTDGDFNVGTTSTGELVRLAEEQAKSGVFLSVLGFGTGNLNDSMLEELSNRANGNYAFIDSAAEAQKVLVDEMSGTLVTIAKDVKIQVEFNPNHVQAWRLIGYENRILAHQDFNDDKKDAGEIGAGHSVTALYEVIPVGVQSDVLVTGVDELKYQQVKEPSETADSGEMLTVNLRYKQPEADQSELLSVPVTDGETEFAQASQDFQHAAAVALFGMLLRGSEHKGVGTYDDVLEIAERTAAGDQAGYRTEFVQLAELANKLQR